MHLPSPLVSRGRALHWQRQPKRAKRPTSSTAVGNATALPGKVRCRRAAAARTPLPLDAFKSFVRTTNGAMPPYRQAVLADEELDDIYAYLQSLPPPKAVSDIPLLNGMRSQ